MRILAIVVRVPQTTQNLVISRCCFAEDGKKKCTKIYNARAKPLFYSLNLQLSYQPRPQALSPLPPFVVGRKTLVAAGHVTTQNLGGKKTCWAGGVAEYFDCCCGKLCGVSKPRAVAKKTTRPIGIEVGFCR